jgi:hypothetical protein
MEDAGRKRKEPPQGGPGEPGQPQRGGGGWCYSQTAGASKRMRLGEPDWITPFCWMCRNPGAAGAAGAAGPEKKSLWSRLLSLASPGRGEPGGP